MSKLNLNENDLQYTVVAVDKISDYAGAESQFTKGDGLTFDELIDAIKYGSETINGYCETSFDEYDNKIFLVFMGGNPNVEEDGEDYIEDCYVTLKVELLGDRKWFGDLDKVINDNL